MAWRLAKSLKTLQDQVNVAYPKRSTLSDGHIGDATHAKTASDHNPTKEGVVCALDLTHDPANGFDVHALAERLRLNPHPNLKYIVSNARIASRLYNWVWRPSSGHFNHAHFSVGVGSDGKSAPGTYDDTTLWNIGGQMSADKLTKEEVIDLHIAFHDGPPGAGYDWRHVGGPLSAAIAAFKPGTRGRLTKSQVEKLHQAILGGAPGNSYDWRHVGNKLQLLLDDWVGSPIALANRIEGKVAGKDTKLVEAGTGGFDKEQLYVDQIAATKKVFGK